MNKNALVKRFYTKIMATKKNKNKSILQHDAFKYKRLEDFGYQRPRFKFERIFREPNAYEKVNDSLETLIDSVTVNKYKSLMDKHNKRAAMLKTYYKTGNKKMVNKILQKIDNENLKQL